MCGPPRRGRDRRAWHISDESPAGMRTWIGGTHLGISPPENTSMLPLAGRSIVNAHRLSSSLRRTAVALGLAVLLGASAARAASPDFDAVSWTAIGCPAADLTTDTSPRSVNF